MIHLESSTVDVLRPFYLRAVAARNEAMHAHNAAYEHHMKVYNLESFGATIKATDAMRLARIDAVRAYIAMRTARELQPRRNRNIS